MLMREAELLECPRKLLDGRSKGDRSFDLHLEHCWLARARDAANDHVVEGVSFTRSLKLDALDEDAGQSPRIKTPRASSAGSALRPAPRRERPPGRLRTGWPRST